MKNWKTPWEELTRQKSAFRLVLIGAAGLLMLALAGLFMLLAALSVGFVREEAAR